MNTTQIKKESLSEIKSKIGGVDTISRKGDVITVRREYFYRMGKTSEDLVNKVKSAFPNATIVDSGDQWAPFRGGASVANSSHWYVKFTLGVTQ